MNKEHPMSKVFSLILFIAALGSAQQPDFPVNLRQGIMAGEVGETSVILQSRLTSSNPNQDPRWEGIRGANGMARFEVAENQNFEKSLMTDWIEASPYSDFLIKTKVHELKKGNRYYYRLHYGPNSDRLRVSDSATFRTLAGDSIPAVYSFAVVSGMNYSFFHYTGNNRIGPYQGADKHLGYPSLASIAKLQPDFFVGTGDNVYYDHPGHRGRAQTRHEMRKKHHEQYSQPRFLDLFSDSATYWMKDDHDHRFDDSDAVKAVRIRAPKQLDDYPRTNIHEGESGAGFEPSHELGLQVFREQLPVTDPADSSPVTYRTHRVSRDLQVWFVEGRDYRSPLDQPDGPTKTIWGSEQKAWLKETLLQSDATFKLLFTPTPLVGPDSSRKRDNHTNFNGYRHEGAEFFRWLIENDISPNEFFIACGDRHWQYHSISADGYEEFSAGALVDANSIMGSFPGDENTTDPDGKIKQPYHYSEPTGGFLVISVVPDGASARADFRFYNENGTLLYEHNKTP